MVRPEQIKAIPQSGLRVQRPTVGFRKYNCTEEKVAAENRAKTFPHLSAAFVVPPPSPPISMTNVLWQKLINANATLPDCQA